ncbi:alpha/beta fold hydrolase [Dickeya chrysanthemi]|uniref:thioesterase domain-containing protein n=1 Tax=Dickeya chrysanthemi TaxID=556 RepID=UPI001CF395BD|nr:alpha/beta fold hydrolase [Dickeya chrysanthemi]MCA7006954.1 phosphopantetheine-binding protein [Dickeya chrysanthemi]
MKIEHQNEDFLSDRPIFIEPTTDLQLIVAGIWSEIFKVEQIGLNDNFFALGGHSLLAVQTLFLIEQRTGIRIPIRDFFESHTVIKLASRIEELRQVEKKEIEDKYPNLLKLHEGTSPFHLVLVHPGGGGGTVAAYRPLLDLLDEDPTIYAFNAIDFDRHSIPASSVSEIAAKYLTQLCSVAPENPCSLVGWSAGGLIAYEMACQMITAGQKPALLGLIDSKPLLRDGFTEKDWRNEFNIFLKFIGWIDVSLPAVQDAETNLVRESTEQWLDQIHEVIRVSANDNTPVSRENLSYVHDVFRSLQSSYAAYKAPSYEGTIELFVPSNEDAVVIDYWNSRVHLNCLTTTTGDHYSMMTMPHVQSIASVLNDRFQHITIALKDQL